MQVDHSEGILRLLFTSFLNQPVVQGIFGRHGGVSPAPYQSLNLGGTTGDSRENVIENRQRIFHFVQRPVESLFDVWQVHGNHVIATNQARPAGTNHQQADAIITNCRDITLMMRFADCVPILIYDPVNHAVGLAHAGWQGTVKRVAEKVVFAMQKEYSSHPDNLLVGIGPAIGRDHYEVRENVISQVALLLPELKDDVIFHKNGKTYFDLCLANQRILEKIGVKEIEHAEICTACHVQDWFSYRVENEKSGRFGALIALQ